MNRQALDHMNRMIELGHSPESFDANGNYIEGREVDITGHGGEYQAKPGYNTWSPKQREDNRAQRVANAQRDARHKLDEAMDQVRASDPGKAAGVEQQNFTRVNGQDVQQTPDHRTWWDVLLGK